MSATHNWSGPVVGRSEEHTSELQSRPHLVCRLLLDKKSRIIFKRVREIGADAVHAAPAYRIKISINVNDANHANAGTWDVRSRSPGNSGRPAHTNETCWVILWRWRAHRPLAESKWNHTDPQKQDKRASNKVRFDR